MIILHLLRGRGGDIERTLIAEQCKTHDVRTLDLDALDITYPELVDRIFEADEVISW